MPDPDAPPPKPPHGCVLFAGLVLSGLLGVAGAIAVMALNGPPWAIPVVFFGAPALYVVGLCVLSIRQVRKYGVGADATPEQRAALPVVMPLLAAFGLVAAVSVGGFVAAKLLNAPGWVETLAFILPGTIFSALSWPYLKTLPERLKRAAPSPERTASRAAPPAGGAARLADDPDPVALPTVPPDPTTPGRTLAVRLPSADASAGCAFLGVTAAAAFWNGIVAVFVWQAVVGFRRGNPEWFMVLFLVPFVLVGLLLVFAAVATAWAWVVSLLAGTVAVEVSDHPFEPGGRYEGQASQAGLFRLRQVGVELVCSESATYVAGTSKSTATEVVGRHPADSPEPLPALPVGFAVAVPADAMHSFASANNAVTWTVTVRGRVFGVLPHARSFQVVVRPGAGDA